MIMKKFTALILTLCLTVIPFSNAVSAVSAFNTEAERVEPTFYDAFEHYDCAGCERISERNETFSFIESIATDSYIKYGDIDGNGQIVTGDSILLAQYLAGWKVYINEPIADCNNDGKISGIDAVMLQQYIAGWDIHLGKSIIAEYVAEKKASCSVPGTAEHYYCRENGKYYSDPYGNNELTPDQLVIEATGDHVDADGDWEFSGAQHYHTCTCGAEFGHEDHKNGIADCKNMAKCSVCSAFYGDVNKANHTGGTEVRGYTEPKCGVAGYTGDTYCLGCDQKIAVGSPINALSEHRDADGDWEFSGAQHYHTCTCGEKFDFSDHTEVIIPAVLPSNGDVSTSLTQGVECNICDAIIIKQENPKEYSGSYGYEYLGTLANGRDLQELYSRYDLAYTTFHLDRNADSEESSADYSLIGYTEIEDLSITYEDVHMVSICYKMDNPLYYWIYGEGADTERPTHIWFYSRTDYRSGALRAQLNIEIYEALQDMVVELPSVYEEALYYHDTIMEGMDYSYKADGITPEDAPWAHNVLGYVKYGKGVCECYAEIFQLIMNYSDNQSIIVNGNTIEPINTPSGYHAWNLIRLDDGNWYWCDLTWDDYGGDDYGHYYFCVNDTQKIYYWDSKTFITDHFPDTPTFGVQPLYILPPRSTVKFDPNK